MLSIHCSIEKASVFAGHLGLCVPGRVQFPGEGDNMKNHQEAKTGLLKPGLMLVALLFIMAAAWAKGGKAKPTVVNLQNGQGKSVGTATLSPGAQGVSVKLNLHDLTPGDHAIHVHQTAKCEGPDFKSAGGHFNPDNKHHGLENPEGPHAGDIPNFVVDVKGKSKATVLAKGVTLGDGANSVFTGGGTALVIHAKADDNKTDPSGNSGDRIACGVIAK
jgi:Cu-Zn family superoxide dismutase